MKVELSIPGFVGLDVVEVISILCDEVADMVGFIDKKDGCCVFVRPRASASYASNVVCLTLPNIKTIMMFLKSIIHEFIHLREKHGRMKNRHVANEAWMNPFELETETETRCLAKDLPKGVQIAMLNLVILIARKKTEQQRMLEEGLFYEE